MKKVYRYKELLTADNSISNTPYALFLELLCTSKVGITFLPHSLAGIISCSYMSYVEFILSNSQLQLNGLLVPELKHNVKAFMFLGHP